MVKVKNKTEIYLTGEIEEFIYEKALSKVSSYQKNLLSEEPNIVLTNKELYHKVISLGDIIFTKLEVEGGEDFDYNQYPFICTTFEHLVDATDEFLRSYCNINFFAGSIVPRENAIILIYQNESLKKINARLSILEENKDNWTDFDYKVFAINKGIYNTQLWIEKYNLNKKTLDNIENCKKMFELI